MSRGRALRVQWSVLQPLEIEPIDFTQQFDKSLGAMGESRFALGGACQRRITDRSGASSVIDVSAAVTVDDVLKKINTSLDISVRATLQGDKIVLTDTTGREFSERGERIRPQRENHLWRRTQK